MADVNYIGGLPVLIDNARYSHGNSYYNTVTSDNDWFITGWFDTGSKNKKKYTIYQPTLESGWTDIKFFNNKTSSSADYWSINHSSTNQANTRSFNSVGRYVACTIKKADAARSWCYCHTTGEWVFKGEHVDANLCMTESRRRIMAVDPVLPPQYQRVEYIKATSYAYIKTNYVPTRYDEFESEFLITNRDYYDCLFSAGRDTYQLVLLLKSGSNYSYLRYFNTIAPDRYFNIQENTWNKLILSANGTLTINNTILSYTYASEIDGNYNNMFILRRRNEDSLFIGKLKSFKITNNGTTKMNLIPCIRLSDMKAGAYDTVSKEFFGSASQAEEFIPSTLDI